MPHGGPHPDPDRILKALQTKGAAQDATRVGTPAPEAEPTQQGPLRGNIGAIEKAFNSFVQGAQAVNEALQVDIPEGMDVTTLEFPAVDPSTAVMRFIPTAIRRAGTGGKNIRFVVKDPQRPLDGAIKGIGALEFNPSTSSGDFIINSIYESDPTARVISYTDRRMPTREPVFTTKQMREAMVDMKRQFPEMGAIRSNSRVTGMRGSRLEELDDKMDALAARRDLSQEQKGEMMDELMGEIQELQKVNIPIPSRITARAEQQARTLGRGPDPEAARQLEDLRNFTISHDPTERREIFNAFKESLDMDEGRLIEELQSIERLLENRGIINRTPLDEL